MKKRVVLILILAVWASLFTGVVLGMTWAGYPLWAAVASAYLLFMFLNGSLAYRSVARRLKLEGKKAPGYLQYLLFPKGMPKLGEDATHRGLLAAPWSNQPVSGFVRICAAIVVLCGALAIAVSVYLTIIEGMDIEQLPYAIAGLAGVGYMVWLFAYAALRGKAPAGWLPARGSDERSAIRRM